MPASSRVVVPLFAPADRPGLLEKAAASGADAVIADLEDGVALAAKPKARQRVAEWLRAPARGVRLVRVNGLTTPPAFRDLTDLDLTHCDAVVVPKAEIGTLCDWPLDAKVVALIETARGMRELDALASLPCVERLQLGQLDLAAELGVSPDSPIFNSVRAQLVLASAAGGLLSPWDGPYPELTDTDGLAASARAARDLGFAGKACIHPRQVAVVQGAFAASAEEIAWARRVVHAVGDTTPGAIRVEGQMVDAPVIKRARAILERCP